MRRVEFELLETYVLDGVRRYRLRIKGTKLVVNVAASSEEEAIREALRLLERSRILDALRG